ETATSGSLPQNAARLSRNGSCRFCYRGSGMARRSTADIAAEWRKEVLSPARWKKALNQSGGPIGAPRAGEAGGCYADAVPLFERRTYMKPGWRYPDRCDARAARE